MKLVRAAAAATAACSYPLPTLPHLRLRVAFRAGTRARLPEFKGFLLRGSFGHALRSVVCAMGRDAACVSCSLRGPCVYTRIFETFVDGERPPQFGGASTSPRPYVFESLTERRDFGAGDLLETELVLMGQAVELQGFVLLALERMARRGFGTRRARFGLERVDYLPGDGRWRTGFRAGVARWPGAVGPVVPVGVEESCERMKLRFLTPTRILVRGQLQRHPEFQALFFAALRRLLDLAHFHVPGASVDWCFQLLLERAGEVRVTRSSLRWVERKRYSDRQRRHIRLDGFVGEMDLLGELGPLLPVLRQAEVVHVGKGATFGMGKVEVLVLP